MKQNFPPNNQTFLAFQAGQGRMIKDVKVFIWQIPEISAGVLVVAPGGG
jgi:hypothetical protein